MPEHVAADLMQAGIVPLCGLETAFSAIAAAQIRPVLDLALPLSVSQDGPGEILSEAVSKTALAAFGVTVPRGVRDLTQADSLAAPLVLKGEGFAHKSEHNAVALHLLHADVGKAAARIQADSYLLEEMVTDPVAELLIGVTADPTCGFLLTLGAGGTLTELLQDTAQLLLPTTEVAVKQALTRLKVSKLLQGYRGKPPANLGAVIAAIMAVQDYVLAHADTIAEVEINPLICTPTRAVAADALIRKTDV
jgi:acetyl-CoA synthetase